MSRPLHVLHLEDNHDYSSLVASKLEAEGLPALGFVHLMPSISTVAMRPIWLLEDLFVVPAGRRKGVATALMTYAENFARETGAERLTLATAHDNRQAQSLYLSLGYLKEEHFWYYHRVLG